MRILNEDVADLVNDTALIDESELRHYIDIQYSAEDIVNLASQINDDVKRLDDAYEELILSMDEYLNGEIEHTEDLDTFYEYMTDYINDNN